MTTVDPNTTEVMAFIALTIVLFILLGSTGIVHLGFYNPFFLPPLKRHYKRILKKEFPFYQMLPPKSQKKFEKRLQYFIAQKQFIPRGGLNQVTDQMKVLIGSCAIQLTFGLPRVYLKHFRIIIIYPESYYSEISRRYHHGEVNPKLKLIVLSWSRFKEGYQKSSDGLNLGLHEMAHALKLENVIRNGSYNFISIDAIKSLNALSNYYMEHPEQTSMLRSYGLSDRHEFFATAVEVYFEQPMEMKNNLPALYKCLSRILNQDIAELYSAKNPVATSQPDS